MIRFNFSKFADENGFVRLRNIVGLEKFKDTFKRMSNVFPLDYNECLYKDYSGSCITNHGKYDFNPMCEAEMFVKRIKKSLPTGWAIIRRKVEHMNEFDYNGKTKYENKVVYVYDYSYKTVKKYGAFLNAIRIKAYESETNELLNYDVCVDDLEDVIFKILTADEINAVEAYRKLVGQLPKPIYRLMKHKQEYKDDYSKYLQDCQNNGFKPIEKAIIDRLDITNNDGTLMTFTPVGRLGWPPDTETEIVNE